MAKASKKTTQKNTVKAKKTLIAEKITLSLIDYKEIMGDKKFETAVKKAAKLFLFEKKIKVAVEKKKTATKPKLKKEKAAVKKATSAKTKKAKVAKIEQKQIPAESKG